MQEWFGQYYPSSSQDAKDVVATILESIARSLGVGPTQLRPDDGLFFELGLQMVPLDDSFDALWDSVVRDLKNGYGLDAACDPSWMTLDDLIQGILGQMAAQEERRQ